ncbi:hypothetical protein CPB85DRAFT_1308579, partial [Mucidula mucida]
QLHKCHTCLPAAFFFFLLNRKVKAATFVPSGLYMVQFTPSYCTAMPLWIYARRSQYFLLGESDSHHSQNFTTVCAS